MKNLFEWCLKQKEGIKRIKPNQKLCEEYQEKTTEDLKAANLLFENKLYSWSIITCYYSMYHSATALLSLIGFKSKNHACTIACLNHIFEETGKSKEKIDWINKSLKTKKELIKAFSEAKKLREEVQYEIKDILPSLALSELEISSQFIEEINLEIAKIKEKQ
ncbi:MAG: HEPN domain-containing protein [Candidatus Diapherotrites archaeon]